MLLSIKIIVGPTIIPVVEEKILKYCFFIGWSVQVLGYNAQTTFDPKQHLAIFFTLHHLLG